MITATVPTQKPLLDLLDEIEQRANAATPGPWGVNTHVNNLANIQGFRGVVASISRWMDGMPGTDQENVANADFIAAARSDVPKLVKALRWYRQRFQFELGIIVPDSATKEPAIKQLMFETDAELAQLLSLPAESIPEQKTDL